MKETMTSLQRVLKTLGHEEPDRVPFFLLLTGHGAKELGIPAREYFSRPQYVAEGQLRLRGKYSHDCLYGFHYAAIEVEAMGGEVIFFDDGPPNAGEPIVKRSGDIEKLKVPDIRETPCLKRALEAIAAMKARAGIEVPVIGVVMSPFSLPVIQMGFDRYIELLYDDMKAHERLMKKNEEFTVAWANAQIDAGATAICYFDPVSSTTCIPPEMYLKTGYEIARRTIARIKGPTATHMASGRCLPILRDIMNTGTAAVAVSALEDLAGIKKICRGGISVIGNLNGIEMARWTEKQAAEEVRTAITAAGSGGGFILSDNHGEIPWNVPDEVLTGISETVHEGGRYPLTRSGGDG